MNTIEQPIDLATMAPDIIETSTGRQIKLASSVRWVYQSLKDIKLWDNLGPAVMNSLTLAKNPIQVLKRCQPYPLTNCEYEVSRHEAKRYGNFSEELPENDLPDNYAGANPHNPRTPHIVETKFAYSAARELSEMYAKEYGLVVLEPITGVEDSEIVRQIFEMVQPVTYKLVTLEKQLVEGAPERIRKSTFNREVKDLARGCLELLKKSCVASMATARQHHGDYSMHIQNASAGRKGSRTTAWPHDEFVAEQLGVEVPRVVQTERKVDTNNELLTKLAERELSRGDENEYLMKALEEEREARERLEEQVQELRAKAAS